MTDIHAKQAFLRQEILDAAVDPAEFLAFLVHANPSKGENLELWALPELTEVVRAFKGSKGLALLSEQQQGGPSGEEGRVNYFEDSLYMEEVECLKKEASRLGSCPELKVRILRFEKNEGGTFERSYISFHIETEAVKGAVSRRYSDFVWLREALGALYPGYPIPPLKKKGNFKRYEDKYLLKKMLILERFLNALVAIPELCSEPLFERFLTSPPKEFEKLKAQRSRPERVAVGSMRTLSGRVAVGTEARMSGRVAKYQEYLRATQPEIKKIYKNFKGVATCFEQANQLFQAISAGCKFLQGREEAIRAELQLPSVIGDSPLSVLESLSREHGAQLLDQAGSFRRDIYGLMKYESLYRLNLLESMEELEARQKEYLQARTALLKRKEKLFAEGRVEKWALEEKLPAKPAKEEALRAMLPKETREVLQLRAAFALGNAQLYQECFRHTRDLNRMLSNYIREFVETQLGNAGRTAQLFGEICKRTQEMERLFEG